MRHFTTNSVKKRRRLTKFCSFHRQGLGQEFRQGLGTFSPRDYVIYAE